MDNTFITRHPNEIIFIRKPRQNHFLKALFKKQVKKITEKAAKKGGLTVEQTADLKTRVDKAMTTGDLGKKINQINTAGNVVAAAAGTALTAGLATGAIAAPAIGAKIAAATTGVGTAIKKAVSSPAQKKVDVNNPMNMDDEPWLGSTPISNPSNSGGDLLAKLKQFAKEKGGEQIAAILEKGRTSPDTLPKTAAQKQMEIDAINEAKNNNNVSAGFMESNLTWIIIGLAFIVVVGLLFKR